MSFYGAYCVFPPVVIEQIIADEDVSDPAWGILEMPGGDDSTFNDIADWVPEVYAGVYMFDGEYILDYFYNYLSSSDTTEYDTWMTTYDGWALGIFFYSYDPLYDFLPGGSDGDYYTTAMMACIDDYCAGSYFYSYISGA